MAKIPGVRKVERLLGHSDRSKLSTSFRRDAREHWAAFRSSYPETAHAHLDKLKWKSHTDQKYLIKASRQFLDKENYASKYWPDGSALHGERSKLISLLIQLFYNISRNLNRKKEGQEEEGEEDVEEASEASEAEGDSEIRPDMSNERADGPRREGRTSEQAQGQSTAGDRSSGGGTGPSPETARSTGFYDVPPDSPVREVRHTSHRPSQPLGSKRPAPSSGASGDEERRRKQQKSNDSAAGTSRSGPGLRFQVLPDRHEHQRRSLRETRPIHQEAAPRPNASHSTETPTKQSREGALRDSGESSASRATGILSPTHSPTGQAPIASMTVMTPAAELHSPAAAQNSETQQEHLPRESAPEPAKNSPSTPLGELNIEYNLIVVRSRAPMLRIVSWIPKQNFESMSLAELQAEVQLGAKFAPDGMMLTLTVPEMLQVVQQVPAGREDKFEAMKAMLKKKTRNFKALGRDRGLLSVDIEIEGVESWNAFRGRDTDEEEEED